MKGFTTSHTIPAKPEAIFAVLADLDQAREWHPSIQSIRKVTEGDMALGSTWIETRAGPKGKPMVSTVKVTEFTPGEAFAIAVDGKQYSVTCRFGLIQKGKGTQVTFEEKGRAKGPLGFLFSGKMQAKMEEMDRDLLERLAAQVAAPKLSTKKPVAKAKVAVKAKAPKRQA